ncbi:TonB-dependent receptor, plug [Parvularcula bermudensis HTCC2503]|uniref:TonB-dependent receptor, plug n=1 Tax=Parvularcula bermudensis (strain ATCC BAA-594 / HTCC2503 / KCTC 12087) TaxID=314260 RepID=E0TGV4_PARBH|nr:TonB-dependent receptor [Parvularcula bermudensis]ADM10713.1 TonB-dependent receptor, plug [Parvularcula bermudensis HTCC2503]
MKKTKPTLGKLLLLGSLSSMALCVGGASAQNAHDFTGMSLEELMSVEVTTVSKRREVASDAAAAVFVLTRADIERSGATTIPDALRLVPGLTVSQINANTWGVTVRGFNSRFANKLLVMIDGRSVFTPLFSGVNWDKQNILLEEIERIEIVRGPGGTLWGANSVNGVINIITRSAKDSQGALFKAGVGNELERQLIARVGGTLGDKGAYRVYTKHEAYDGSTTAEGIDANDDWNILTGGIRADLDLSSTDALMVNAEFTTIEAGETLDLPLLTAPYSVRSPADIERDNAHILTRWTRTMENDRELSIQAYIDHSDITIPQGQEERTTFDIALQHSTNIAQDHHLLFGLGYRSIADEIKNSSFVSITNNETIVEIVSGFVQDIYDVSDDFKLTFGSKFSYNDYTGFELQPSARFIWQPSESQTYWGAISRAVRIPSRVEDQVQLIGTVVPPLTPTTNPRPLPAAFVFTGSDKVESETLVSLELGARFRPAPGISVDLATFYNDYDNLRASSLQAPQPGILNGEMATIVPLTVADVVSAQSFGTEMVANWQVKPNWRLQGTLTLIDFNTDDLDDPTLIATPAGSRDPASQATFRSLHDVNDRINFDFVVRYVDNLEDFDIDDYTQLDIHGSYDLSDRVSLSVAGRNLLDDEHYEFGVDPSYATLPTAVERSFFISLTAQY